MALQDLSKEQMYVLTDIMSKHYLEMKDNIDSNYKYVDILQSENDRLMEELRRYRDKHGELDEQ